MNNRTTTSASALLSTFIDSIDVKIKKAEYRSIIKPVYFNGTIQSADIFLGFNKGKYVSGNSNIPEGSFYFIPRGQKANAGFLQWTGQGTDAVQSFADDHVRDEYTRSMSTGQDDQSYISYVAFETVLYNAFPFFPLLELPAFVIPGDEKFSLLLKEICEEHEQDRIGKNRILSNYLGELVVHLFRFIHSQPELNKSIDKLQYLTDVRLIDIVKYVQDNLDKDLTNASIAKIAYVSDDYVGQFFKALTGRTLQDYIEHQRLDRAMILLKTIPNSVQEVAAMVGFKDAAYFSRRFRLRFGINANMIRQGKSQVTG